MFDLEKIDISKVLYYFEEISKIPRPSGREKEISDYLVKFANERDLWVFQDDFNNVIIKKDAHKGYENSPVVILQGHIDMVCEKNSDVEHNFLTDPIKLVYDGDFIKAEGTTLGGDNGVAVAMMLALLDSDDIPYPKIEAVFTTDEEVGMIGASNLDTTNLEGKYILNLDSEDEGEFTVGCAGGMKSHSHFKYIKEETNKNYTTYELSVKGLLGGHSGVDIHRKRANANILLFRVLNELNKSFKISVNTFKGGAKDNAIPREAFAKISFNKEDLCDIIKMVDKSKENIIKEFYNTDSGIEITLKETEFESMALSKEFVNRLITFVLLCPNGINTMSSDIEGLVESSNNLGVITDTGQEIECICAVRSSNISLKYHILDKIKLLTEVCGGNLDYMGDYPAWEFRQNSYIRDLFNKTFKDMYGKEAKIVTIHAGLECGIFAEKIKNSDIISFGPDLYDIHTPMEKLSISSLKRVWEFLKVVLKEIK